MLELVGEAAAKGGGVKKTTEPMAMMRNSMLPICFMKEAAKADSVWVRVSEAEFANSWSMALATRRAVARVLHADDVPADDPLPVARRLLVEVLVLIQSWPWSSWGRVPGRSRGG